MSDGDERSGEQRALDFLEFLDQPDNELLRDELQRATFDLFVKKGADRGYHFTDHDLHKLLKPVKYWANVWGKGGGRKG